MERFGRILKLTVVVAVLLGSVSCGGNNKDSENKDSKQTIVVKKKTMETLNSVGKENMVPDGAVAAMKIMPQQLWTKTIGQPGSQGYDLWQNVKSQSSLLSLGLGELGSMLTDAFDNPDALGLSLTEPLVLSVALDPKTASETNQSFELYVVATLSSRASFEKFMDALVPFAGKATDRKITKEIIADTFTYYNLYSENSQYADLAILEKSAVLRFSYSADKQSDDLKKSMSELFADGRHKGSDAMKDFYATGADVALWLDYDKVMSFMPESGMDMSMFKGSSIVSDLDFSNGKTVLNVKMHGSEKIKEYAQKYNAVASDKYFKYLPASSVLVMNAAVKDLPGLLDEYAAMNPELTEYLEYFEDEFGFDQDLLAGISGQVVIAVDGRNLGNDDEIPGVIAFVECEESVWDYIEESVSGYSQKYGRNTYLLADNLIVKYDGCALVFGNEKTISGGSSVFADTAFSKEISTGGVLLNLEELPISLLNELIDECDIPLSGRELLKYMSSITVSSSYDHMSGTITCNMGDKKHNMLELLFSEIISQMSLY